MVGGAGTDLRADAGPRAAFHLGGKADVLFLRERSRGMGLGPYVDVATAAFDTLELGGGVDWLVPVGGPAFVFSAGSFARTSRFGWEPGLSSTVFFGSRAYNFHSTYGFSLGLFVQGRYGLGDGAQADLIGGAQIDLAFFAMPFILAYEAMR